jgi:hypothetical protein
MLANRADYRAESNIVEVFPEENPLERVRADIELFHEEAGFFEPFASSFLGKDGSFEVDGETGELVLRGVRSEVTRFVSFIEEVDSITLEWLAEGSR